MDRRGMLGGREAHGDATQLDLVAVIHGRRRLGGELCRLMKVKLVLF